MTELESFINAVQTSYPFMRVIQLADAEFEFLRIGCRLCGECIPVICTVYGNTNGPSGKYGKYGTYWTQEMMSFLQMHEKEYYYMQYKQQANLQNQANYENALSQQNSLGNIGSLSGLSSLSGVSNTSGFLGPSSSGYQNYFYYPPKDDIKLVSPTPKVVVEVMEFKGRKFRE